MTEHEALDRMVAPGTRRPGKYREGVIQIHLTRACNRACFNCTQGSNLVGKPTFITPEQFETALVSLKGYWGVVGIFGGNPALHPRFADICLILQKHFPKEQRGLWCNDPVGKGKVMRQTFDPRVSNLNVHMDPAAYQEFKRDWPESQPFGRDSDSRHSPCYVAMKDILKKDCPKCLGEGNGQWDHDTGCELPTIECDCCGGGGKVYDDGKAWELISQCDINQHWSAMIGVFRGQLRAWFCEIAGAQAMLHADDPFYPDTGVSIGLPGRAYCVGPRFNEYSLREGLPAGHRKVSAWWELPMHSFKDQVRKHCHECSVPLRGYGELAIEDEQVGREQTSVTHQAIYHPKRKGRRVELVTVPEQLGKPLRKMTDYLGNARGK